MKVKVIITAVLALLLIGTAVAQTSQTTWPPFSDNVYSYTGAGANERRLTISPFSRDLYFGYGYNPTFVNYGAKGPVISNLGAKGVDSSSFNLDTNAYRVQGRNPGRISNWDPNVRGYAQIDIAVEMFPYDPTLLTANYADILPKGMARLTSTGNAYGGGSSTPYPTTQILVQARNLPPLPENEIYEVWLMDAETEQAITLGLLKGSLGLTAQMVNVIPRLVDQFDYIMITKEPFPDLNPGPGEIVLMGEIDPSRTEVRPSTAGLNPIR